MRRLARLSLSTDLTPPSQAGQSACTDRELELDRPGARRTAIADTLLPPVTIVAMLAAMYLIFVAVPIDSFQGPVQRIFYVHMAMWLATFTAFGIVAFASLHVPVEATDRAGTTAARPPPSSAFSSAPSVSPPARSGPSRSGARGGPWTRASP